MFFTLDLAIRLFTKDAGADIDSAHAQRQASARVCLLSREFFVFLGGAFASISNPRAQL